MTVAQRSLDNLRRWQPGESGNPSGRQPEVVYVSEELRRMADLTVGELQAVSADETSTSNRRAAALLMLGSSDPSLPPSHRVAAFSELADRTSGKAVQAIQVTQAVVTDPSAMLAHLRERYPQRLPPGSAPALPDT